MFHKDDVEVFTTEVGVTIRRFDLKNPFLHLEDRDIERSTSKIIYSNDRRFGTVETICKGSGSRLIDNTEDVETRNLTSIFSSLPLRVVEVRGDGDDSMAKWNELDKNEMIGSPRT